MARHIRKQFESSLREVFPCARRVLDAPVPSGWVVYHCGSTGSITRFVVLCVDPTQDRFTVECAWSRHGAFPADARLQRPCDCPARGTPADRPSGEQFRFRLSGLWCEPDAWWPHDHAVRAQAQANRVSAAAESGDPEQILEALQAFGNTPASPSDAGVRDAIAAVREHALPYFSVAGRAESGDNTTSVQGPI